MCIAFIAHQARALGPKAHHFGGDFAIVCRAAVSASRGPGAKRLFAQIPPRRELQKWLDARPRQRDGTFSGMAVLSGDSRRAGDEKIR